MMWASAPVNIVQGLKPVVFFGLVGTTKVVP
jgi:hypothetical protein